MDHTLVEPASMALLLLAVPMILNLFTIIKSRSKFLFYAMMISTSAGLAIGTFLYGPVSEPIRVSRWIVLSLDRPAWLFVILVYLCWSITLLYCMGYLSSHISQKAETFHRFLSATLGLSIAAGMRYIQV
jgi:formate hydrogenlyase subunit 3/multisubunit Na+/H+ antiporter MnhD subunit